MFKFSKANTFFLFDSIYFFLSISHKPNLFINADLKLLFSGIINAQLENFIRFYNHSV